MALKKKKAKKPAAAARSGRPPTPKEISMAQEESTQRNAYIADPIALDDPPLIATDLARHLDMAPPRVGVLANEGILPRNADGTYPMNACRVAYIRFVRRAAQFRLKQGNTGQGLADARLMKVKMDIAVQKGILVNIDDVEANIVDAFSKLRTELAGIGASVTRDLKLREAINEAVNERIDRYRTTLEASAAAVPSDSGDDVEGEEAAA